MIGAKLPDIVSPGADLASQRGLELGGRFARNFPNMRVIILNPNPKDEGLFDAIKSSAVACPGKNSSQDCAHAVVLAIRGGLIKLGDSPGNSSANS